MDIIQETHKRLIDYNKVKDTCYFNLVDNRDVDISVIIPVHGRTQFNKVVSKYFLDAITHIWKHSNKTVSLTFVEHSIVPEHKDLCEKWVNYIHIPIGESRFNKCLAHNIGALYSNACQYYLFHDADTIVPKDFFEKLLLNIHGIEAVQSFTERRLIYCNEEITNRIINGDDHIEHFNANRPDVKVGSSGASGGSMFVRHKLFVAVGGYDPDFFTEYSIEDQFFFDKLTICGSLGFCDKPAIELFHLYHAISFNQTTKDCDFHIFNTFHDSGMQIKKQVIQIKNDHFKKFIRKPMQKPDIKIYDTQFAHSGQGSFGAGDLKLEPDFFNWYRGSAKRGDIIVITESGYHLVDTFKEPIKILMIIESPLINPDLYKALTFKKNYNKFTYILTFNKDLVKVNPEKFIWYPFGGCWILEEHRKVYPKSKGVSIIASNKRITDGHILRHDAIKSFRDRIQGVYGNGYHFIQSKLEALHEFRYSIVIENDNNDAMFSEKIIDCFLTGVIPIYWGCKSIADYFNPTGVLVFNNLAELDQCLITATENYYNNNMAAVNENFIKAAQYALPENWIWENFLKPIYLMGNVFSGKDTTQEQERYKDIIEHILSMLHKNGGQSLDRSFLLTHLGHDFTVNENEIVKYMHTYNLCSIKKEFGMHTYSLTENGSQIMGQYGSLKQSRAI